MKNPTAYPPMGLYYVLGTLATYRPEWQVDICDMNLQNDFDTHYDIYLITINIVQISSAKILIEKIRKTNTKAYIVLGGPMAPYLINEVGSIGESLVYSGESTIELISVLEEKMQGNYFIQNISMVSERFLWVNEVFRKYDSYDQGIRSFSYYYSRGCPHSCAFCSKGIMRYFSRKVRYTPKSILERDFNDIAKLGIKHIRLWDDTLGINDEYDDILFNIFKEYKLSFDCQMRSEYINKKRLNKMLEAGCNGIRVGFESFDNDILESINKQTTYNDNINAIVCCRDLEMPLKGLFIIGLPGESLKSIYLNRNIIEKFKLSFTVSIFCPYPGSPIWENPSNYEIIFSKKEILLNSLNSYYSKDGKYNCFVETKSLSKEDIIREHNSYYGLLPGLSASEGSGKKYN
jgi:radical SAM superfamily enzyme YgiQ (UPF0313 family)